MYRLTIARLKEFARDGRGAVSTEALLILPVLIWAYLAMFVFWEAFRATNTNAKATYTVADMISRESEPVNMAYINGLASIHRYIANTPEPTSIRVSTVQYLANGDVYRVLWSRNTAPGGLQLTDAMLVTLRDRLPVMTDGDTVLVVESRRGFRPAFLMGLEPMTMTQFTVTRPRFDTAVCFVTPNCFNLSS